MQSDIIIVVNKNNSKLPSVKVEKVLACMHHAMIYIIIYIYIYIPFASCSCLSSLSNQVSLDLHLDH